MLCAPPATTEYTKPPPITTRILRSPNTSNQESNAPMNSKTRLVGGWGACSAPSAGKSDSFRSCVRACARGEGCYYASFREIVSFLLPLFCPYIAQLFPREEQTSLTSTSANDRSHSAPLSSQHTHLRMHQLFYCGTCDSYSQGLKRI